MVSKWGTAQKFRQEFIVPDKTVLRWFPGHMAGGKYLFFVCFAQLKKRTFQSHLCGHYLI